jgi:glycosyltransferase involved in cell wall biosynthesis
MRVKKPFFTLLIACKNEENDIHLALDSSISQTYLDREIICVDDSTDNTKKIILKYEKFGVRLIDGHREGCCMARNLGLHEAKGDVIVFLTADTKLNPNYLESIKKYYEGGYDIVAVASFSYNIKSVYSRFIEMQYRLEDTNQNFNPYTTQGYSVRRIPALKVGGISGGAYPFNTCRDWTLVKKMEDAGYKKVYDRSIVVPHKSPDNLSEYWLVRKTRGMMSAYQPHYMFNRSLYYLLVKFIAKDIKAILLFILIFPWFIKLLRISSYSEEPIKDFFKFAFASAVQSIAFILGEWIGLKNMCTYEKQFKKHSCNSKR